MPCVLSTPRVVLVLIAMHLTSGGPGHPVTVRKNTCRRLTVRITAPLRRLQHQLRPPSCQASLTRPQSAQRPQQFRLQYLASQPVQYIHARQTMIAAQKHSVAAPQSKKFSRDLHGKRAMGDCLPDSQQLNHYTSIPVVSSASSTASSVTAATADTRAEAIMTSIPQATATVTAVTSSSSSMTITGCIPVSTCASQQCSSQSECCLDTYCLDNECTPSPNLWPTYYYDQHHTATNNDDCCSGTSCACLCS